MRLSGFISSAGLGDLCEISDAGSRCRDRRGEWQEAQQRERERERVRQEREQERQRDRGPELEWEP